MAKGKLVSKLVSIVVWVTGVLVSLAVGFGMIQGILTVPGLGFNNNILTVIAGWVVVVLTILSVVLAIVDNL